MRRVVTDRSCEGDGREDMKVSKVVASKNSSVEGRGCCLDDDADGRRTEGW